MDLSDMREQLVSTLKMAYKKINSLNAATRKINAVMAILFMKRDKAKTDVVSLARRLSAKLVLLQSTFEKEIEEIVEKKVKTMEDQNQIVFDEICTLGEVCVEAEKVLKIQNEDKLAKDGVRLTERFHSLLDSAQDIEDLGDLDDSMFLQFVPGELESKFDNSTFGQIYTSNKDSGISFSCASISVDLDSSVSPVAKGGCVKEMVLKNAKKDWGTLQGSKSSSCKDVSVPFHDDSANVSCPPGFESEHSKTSPPVLQYVSRPPNKALAQSTPVGKEPVVQISERETLTQHSIATNKKACQHESRKGSKIEPRIELSESKVKAEGMKLPVITEKWEEEMCEISEISSVMSARLRKSIYDRMKPDLDEAEPELDSKHVQGSKGGSASEPWDLSIPECGPSPVTCKSRLSAAQGTHVRRLFENKEGPLPQKKEEKMWDTSVCVDSRVTSVSTGSSKSEIAKQPLQETEHCTNVNNSHDDWWDAPVPVNEKKYDEDGVKKNVTKKTVEEKTGIIQRLSSSSSKLSTIQMMVDSWEELEEEQKTTSAFCEQHTSVDSSHSSDSIEENNFRSVSPSVELYSWGKKSKDGSPDTKGIQNVDVAHKKATEVDAGETVQCKAKSENVEGECKRDSVSPKKASSIISGRMKNLLKTYIESNKENILCSPGDHAKTMMNEDILNDCPAENAESYKSKLMKDTGVLDKPEKQRNGGEKTFTTLGTVPSKSKPPEKSQLRKTLPQDPFALKPCDRPDSLLPSPKSESRIPVEEKVENSWETSEIKDNKVSKRETELNSKTIEKTEMHTLRSPIPKLIQPDNKSIAQENESCSESAAYRNKPDHKYTDLSQLVFSGNCWSELSATLVTKIGHLHKGDGEGFFFPIGVSQNSRGDIIVGDNGNDLVKIIKNGVFERTLGKGDVTFDHPSAIVVNEEDEIYVKDNSGIFKFDQKGNLLFQFGQKILKRPYGLALSYNGYLVTLDVTRNNHLLYLFHQNGTVFRSNSFGPLMNNMQFSKCRFLEVYREKVLVSDLGLSVMYLGNLFGQVFRCFGYLGSAPGMLREPSGVTVDSAGNWVIADSKNDRIQVFSPNGQFLFPIKLSEPIYRPSDIILTPDRHLLVVNYLTHSVKIYKLG